MTTKTTRPAQPDARTTGLDTGEIRERLHVMHTELEAEHAEALAVVTNVGQTVEAGGDDEVDYGARTSQREQQLTLVAGIRDRLDQIEHAMRRIDTGTYGTCEVCGEVIPAERLEAFPAATTCVRCKQTSERRAG